MDGLVNEWDKFINFASSPFRRTILLQKESFESQFSPHAHIAQNSAF